MKKIFYSIMAIAALTACNKEQVSTAPQADDSVIRLTSANVGVATKAPVDGTTFTGQTAIVLASTVSGNYTSDNLYGETANMYMKFNGTAASGFCTADGTRQDKYYDGANTTYLYGLYPHASWGAPGSESYTLTIDGKTDAMTAPEVAVSKAANTGEGKQPGNLTFAHRLTKLLVTAEVTEGEGYWDNITGIELIEAGGRFSGKSEFDVALPAGSVTVTDDAYSPAGIVMIEPRDLSSRNGSLTIYITAEDATGTVRESEIAIDRNSYQESGITTPDLQAGYSYKIRLELMQDDVTFTLVPAEWKTVEQPVDIGKTEPYVRGGDNYIITRNMFGNASGWDVRDDEWAGAQASGNTVPPVMEVAVSDAAGSADWNTAGTVCPSGWHLPTEQELKLIWTYQDRLCKEGHVPLEGNYWSCTEAGNGSYYYVDMDAESYVRQSAASSETGNVRCVRDIANSIDY